MIWCNGGWFSFPKWIFPFNCLKVFHCKIFHFFFINYLWKKLDSFRLSFLIIASVRHSHKKKPKLLFQQTWAKNASSNKFFRIDVICFKMNEYYGIAIALKWNETSKLWEVLLRLLFAIATTPYPYTQYISFPFSFLSQFFFFSQKNKISSFAETCWFKKLTHSRYFFYFIFFAFQLKKQLVKINH